MLLLIFVFVCCHCEWWQWPLAAVVALLLQLLPFVCCLFRSLYSIMLEICGDRLNLTLLKDNKSGDPQFISFF